MDGIIPTMPYSVKRRLRRRTKRTKDTPLRTRYLIVVSLADGRSPTDTARALIVSRSTIYRVAARYRQQGETGLVDRREDNGDVKCDEAYLATLYEVVEGQPEDHGWMRSTWTQELLAATMAELIGIRVHAGTLCRALKAIGARLGQPRPTVGCPWSPQARGRRLKAIERMLAGRPADEVAVYQDEVDIHLNPKIGPDWMVRGQQKEVLTPGQNVKRYVAGTLDAVTGELCWVQGERKSSDLFIALLWKLPTVYPEAKVIHVILDNYRIHSSASTQQALAALAGRVVLHFLPPYCPNANRIERYWRDLHAGVTRNHRCRTMDELMARVRRFLQRRQRRCKPRHKKHGQTRQKTKAA